jgi:hypothetical protein
VQGHSDGQGHEVEYGTVGWRECALPLSYADEKLADDAPGVLQWY